MDLSNIPDTSGICPGCLGELSFKYIGCQPAASTVMYSPRRGSATVMPPRLHPSNCTQSKPWRLRVWAGPRCVRPQRWGPCVMVRFLWYWGPKVCEILHLPRLVTKQSRATLFFFKINEKKRTRRDPPQTSQAKDWQSFTFESNSTWQWACSSWPRNIAEPLAQVLPAGILTRLMDDCFYYLKQ